MANSCLKILNKSAPSINIKSQYAYDAATGLYNYGYRDYSPQAGRFTTTDPIRDGSNWYAYVNNDPVNWKDPWGLDKVLTIYNIDPTPGIDEIINRSGDAGHTWVSMDGDHYGWGYDGAPSSGTIPGRLLRSREGNLDGRTVTSRYQKIITDEQADAIEAYFRELESAGTGYNLGGSGIYSNATMCTEAVVNALTSSGALTPEEAAIITAQYQPWINSFPYPIPPGFEEMALIVAGLTSPNPNEFGGRLNQLNKNN
jgi:RHS repeat-associated protein